MTILVTGARGGVARAIIKQLLAKGETVRAASSNAAETPPIDGVTVIGLDLSNAESIEAALDGVDRVFTYAAHSGIDTFIDVAKKADVRHIVLLSSIAAQFPGNEIGRIHLAAENPLRESGIPLTILRPGMFATNASWWGQAIKSGETVRIPYPDAQVNPVSELDMATVAVTALTSPGHEGKIYPLGGPESLSQRRMVETIGEALGREIEVDVLSHEQAAKFMPEPVLQMFAANGGKPVPTGPLSQDVTGIPSQTFAQWAADHVDDFR